MVSGVVVGGAINEATSDKDTSCYYDASFITMHSKLCIA
jgi:hypothetical protein